LLTKTSIARPRPAICVGEDHGGPRLREIGRDHRRAGARLAQFGGKRLQRRDAARREHEVVPVPRQLARQFRADAAGRAGDQRQGTGGVAVHAVSL